MFRSHAILIYSTCYCKLLLCLDVNIYTFIVQIKFRIHVVLVLRSNRFTSLHFNDPC